MSDSEEWPVNAIELNDVAIRYMVGDFKEIGIKEYVVRRLKRNYHVKEFWAVDGVTFSLEKGSMLGIVGSNGAGKSTLLKVITGIMEPTRGKVKVNGTIAALLELASGFDGAREHLSARGHAGLYTRLYE